jgi:molybdenum cofactor synthesis domain-containing protein
MLKPSEALAEILRRVPLAEAVEACPLAEAAQRVLARAAVSDVDLPPFEKSMMDGFAVRSSDFELAGRSLNCIGESRAGEPFQGRVEPGQCVEIFTGAELPADCDAVEMIERTARQGESSDTGPVAFERTVPVGQHVAHRAEILGEGRSVFEPGRRLSATDLSVLASIGCDPVPVHPRPVISVLTTGDELVRATEKPGLGQIREGNTLYLKAACERLGCDVRRAEIVPDDADALERAFGEALENGDALITTGGVSVGKYDLVGATFERLGVEPVLHKVAIKPGKPIWFGLAGSKPVFGLPGNPVSSLLGFEAFVRPAARVHANTTSQPACATGRTGSPSSSPFPGVARPTSWR